MNRIAVVVMMAVMGGAPLAVAQAGSLDPAGYVPRFTASLGYNFLRANAPPAGCDCFALQGGYASASMAFKYWLSGAAEVTGSHANKIGPLGQDLTLMTYTAGPRITLRHPRTTLFAQALFGAAHGSNSYFPTATSFSTSATSFALSTGGGLDVRLNHRFDVRAFELQYLRSSLPNGTTNTQNHLVVGAGIVMKLRGHLWSPDPGHLRKKADEAMQKAEGQPSSPAPTPR